MTIEQTLQAITLVMENHSTTMTVNHIRHDSNFVPDALPLVIHKCVPAVINKLHEAGFMLSMGPEGLIVDYI